MKKQSKLNTLARLVKVVQLLAGGLYGQGIIGLARAFLHNAPFLLLDEPTSNLDSLNEAVILRSLKEEAKGKTIALVSHRLSTVRIADEVVSVENGRRKTEAFNAKSES